MQNIWIYILIISLSILLGIIFYLIKKERNLAMQNDFVKEEVKFQTQKHLQNIQKDKITQEINQEVSKSYEKLSFEIYELNKEIINSNLK